MLEKDIESAVLSYAKCTELPEPLKEGQIFIRAIAKVRKANNSESLCIIVNNGENKPLIKKTFGSASPIKEVLEIYPLSVLDSNAVPEFKKKDELVRFLVACGEPQKKTEALVGSKDKADKETLQKLLIKHCIRLQIEREKTGAVAIQEKQMLDEQAKGDNGEETDKTEDKVEDKTEDKVEDNGNQETETGTGESGEGTSEETPIED